jgi:hypothetical protein
VHTLQALNPADFAEVIDSKWTRFSGFVLRPGGQFGRQKILVVVHPLMAEPGIG